MKKSIYVLIVLIYTGLIAMPAQSAWVIKNIIFDGLHRLPAKTVRHYLPPQLNIKHFAPQDATSIIQYLYKSQLFEQVSIYKNNNTLIIRVIESPIIGQFNITGNVLIPTDKLKIVTEAIKISAGQIYHPSKVHQLKQSLFNEYYRLGYYNIKIHTSMTHLSQNRIALQIKISEGVVARIKQVNMIGNHAFTEQALIAAMQIQTHGWLAAFTKADHYSETKLTEALERLRNFYLDRGYLRIAIQSTQIEMSPDRKSMTLTFVLDEGKQYTIKNYTVTDSSLLSSPFYKTIMAKIKPGDIFVKKTITEIQQSLIRHLSKKGYLFAKITILPLFDDATAQVSLRLNIFPGQMIYVRHISFSQNNHTNDNTLRRVISQWEAAPALLNALEESEHKLKLLPYIREAKMQLQPVPHSHQQVDVNYEVQEDSAAQASLRLGYSPIYHLILGGGINYQNFLGTGNAIGLNLMHSRYEQFYGFDYTNPYYTPDGISRSISLSASRIDPRGGGLDNAYTTHEYNASVLYNIPIKLGQQEGVFSGLSVGLGYQNILVKLANSGISNQIHDFIEKYGKHFYELDTTIGLSRNSLDKAIFPTQGTSQKISLDLYLPLSSHSLTFYTLNYHIRNYYPILSQFILINRVDVGYGANWHSSEEFPFFKNYYAGGLDSVRGYKGNSLGPMDSNQNPFGGNILIDGSIGCIIPNHFSDNLRTSIFLDAGNVYSSKSNNRFGGSSTNTGPLRYSIGIEADFLTPVGPFSISLAQPIHRKKRDFTEILQIALGANF